MSAAVAMLEASRGSLSLASRWCGGSLVSLASRAYDELPAMSRG